MPYRNKAKLMWIKEPEKCKCDICAKKCSTMFHLYDHWKSEHRYPEVFIINKINETKYNKSEIAKTNEETMAKMLQFQLQNIQSQDLLLKSMMKKDDIKENKQSLHVQKPEFVPEWSKIPKVRNI